jgi:hypothetical protein
MRARATGRALARNHKCPLKGLAHETSTPLQTDHSFAFDEAALPVGWILPRRRFLWHVATAGAVVLRRHASLESLVRTFVIIFLPVSVLTICTFRLTEDGADENFAPCRANCAWNIAGRSIM